MKKEVIRLDLILSYWLFFWWVLYELKIVTANPKLFLMLGFLVNLIMLAIKIAKHSHVIVPFIIINSIIKVIPLLVLMNTTITQQDVSVSLTVAVIYIAWVVINMETVIKNINNRAIPPFEYWWINKYNSV